MGTEQRVGSRFNILPGLRCYDSAVERGKSTYFVYSERGLSSPHVLHRFSLAAGCPGSIDRISSILHSIHHDCSPSLDLCVIVLPVSVQHSRSLGQQHSSGTLQASKLELAPVVSLPAVAWEVFETLDLPTGGA